MEIIFLMQKYIYTDCYIYIYTECYRFVAQNLWNYEHKTF